MELIQPWCLGTATIWQEAAGEPYEGKVAVGEVIRRRMRLKYASRGTVASTVLAPMQFSGWNAASPIRARSCEAQLESPVVQECKRAWEESETSNLVPDAVLYHADYVAPDWAKRVKLVKKIGRHLFYADPATEGS